MVRCSVVKIWILISCLLTLSVARAQAPAWWEAQAVTDPAFEGSPDTNYAPALLGQAKFLALAAYREMEARSPGSAGGEIESMVTGFEQDPPANYAPLLIGQLKELSRPFYDRFQAEAFSLSESLPVGPEGYPWGFPEVPDTPYAPATLGQLKQVFSFSLEGWPPQPLDPSLDSDGDGLPDLWEISNGLNPRDPTDGEADLDGDGLSALEEFAAHTDSKIPDTDGDGIWDGAEIGSGFNPLRPDHPAVELVLFTPLIPAGPQ